MKSESLLGVEQFSESFVTVNKKEPEMRIEEIPHRDIFITITVPLLKIYLLRNTIEPMVSDAFSVLPLVLSFSFVFLTLLGTNLM